MIVPGVNVTAIAGKGISGLPLHLLGAMPTLQSRNQAPQKDNWLQNVISIFKVSPNNFTLLKIIIKWKKKSLVLKMNQEVGLLRDTDSSSELEQMRKEMFRQAQTKPNNISHPSFHQEIGLVGLFCPSDSQLTN